MKKSAKKSEPAEVASVNPEMPIHLATSLTLARTHMLPTFDEEHYNLWSRLIEYISPREVKLPGKTTEDRPRDAFSEPLLMISWDRRAGQFKWSISNKTLNYGCGGLLPIDPASWLAEVERQIDRNEHSPRQLKAVR